MCYFRKCFNFLLNRTWFIKKIYFELNFILMLVKLWKIINALNYKKIKLKLLKFINEAIKPSGDQQLSVRMFHNSALRNSSHDDFTYSSHSPILLHMLLSIISFSLFEICTWNVFNISCSPLHVTRAAAVEKKNRDELLCFNFIYYLSFVSL